MSLKIALIYDRVNTPHGGAEQVLLALHQAFPDAPLYTSVYDSHKAPWASVFSVISSFLQSFPGALTHHRLFAPLMPLAFEMFNLDEYDVIISITSAEAKGVVTKPHQLHLCYLLTPTRYLYSHKRQYEHTHWPFRLPFVNFISKKLLAYMEWWDQAAAARPDIIIPISKRVEERTKEYYHRQTEGVIYPPIQPATSTSKPRMTEDTPESYLLVISRLVPYKRIELIIKAAQRLKKTLVIIGEGPEKERLQTLATDTTVFLGSVSDEAKQAFLNQAEALIMPGIEDFGITAVEAVHAGVPVILHQKSGAAELLPHKEVALHISHLGVKNLVEAIKALPHTKFEFTHTRKKLQKYAINNFVARFTELVTDQWKRHQKGEI